MAIRGSIVGAAILASSSVAANAHAHTPASVAWQNPADPVPSPFATPKVQLGQNSYTGITNKGLLAGLPQLSASNVLAAPGYTIRRDYDQPLPNQSKLRYLRAAANVMIANYLVWQQNWIGGREYIFPTRAAWSSAFKNGFEWDKDPIQTNFFGHPYHGSFYFTGARAAGLTFWEAVPYALGGSFTWEMFSETERPSMNDIFSTTFGGIILGETLYRISSQLLDESTSGWERLGRELLAAGVAPMRGLDRVITRQAWKDGPAGVHKRFEIAFNTGLERVGTIEFNNDIPALEGTPTADAKRTALLTAVQVDYGDYLPSNDRGTLGPFDAFRFYASANVSSRDGFKGVQIYGDGLLHGWSSFLTKDTGHEQDNNVIGFNATYDYQGISQVNLSGIGIGPGDTIMFRRRNGQTFRLGLDFQWVPILGTTSADTADSGRDYNLAVGAAAGVNMMWDLARYGRLGIRARHYLGAVVSGEDGTEYTQYSRLWYEIDFVPKMLGAGIASTVVSRYGKYDNGTVFRGNFETTQLYVTLHN